MKKLALAFATMGAIASLAVVPALASADAATIERDTGTTWFDGNGTPVFVPDGNIQVVYTNNPDGTTNVSAHGTLPDGSVLPAKAQHYDNANTGFICGFGGTIDFSGVTTPSGQFSFTCKDH